ncbi:MAG: M15 family metallopeptidase [Actinomycetota bacterium]|nr:M15 family metallopeptidase [Actinomycetota bacterium]
MPGRRHPALWLVLSAATLVACSSSPMSPGQVAPSPATTVAAATVPAATSAAPEPTTTAPSGFVATTAPVATADLGGSWREGCPLAPDRLRLVKLPYWGFDDQAHPGSLVLNVAIVDAATAVFRRLYDAHFPIRRMEPIDVFGGDDNASMAADNTSGFNCRLAVASGPPQWSAHAYGEAIDVNPVENPYIEGGAVLPPSGAAYVDRSNDRPGMALPDSTLNAAFAAAGWSWGGQWSSPDYQHFSATGG